MNKLNKSYISIISIVLLISLFFFLNILWLVFPLVSMVVLFILLKSIKTTSEKAFILGIQFILKYFSGILLMLTVGILFRLFFIEIYAIPSSSMESSLIPGDKIISNKLSYGPILPQSPYQIPWVNLFFYLSSDDPEEAKKNWWKYKRLSGVSSIGAGDVVLFKIPSKGGTTLVKRCVGTPGDSLSVIDAMPTTVFNKERVKENVLLPLNILTSDIQKTRHKLDSLGLRSQQIHSEGHGSERPLRSRVPQILVEKINDWEEVDSVKIDSVRKGFKSNYLRKIDSTWTIFNFGPLVIPYEGMKIFLDEKTFSTYSRSINRYEENKIKYKDGRFTLNDKPVTEYTFKYNYYFMMGDNREDSRDSRYISFIPEYKIIGKADLVLFSNDASGFNWSRFLMGID